MLQIQNITFAIGHQVLLEDTSLTVYPQHHVAITGKNGVGKSTLFNLLLGQYELDQGDIFIPKNWRIAAINQNMDNLECSAIDYVLNGDRIYRELERNIEVVSQLGSGEEIAQAHEAFAAYYGYEFPAKAGKLLEGLGFATEEHTHKVESFSGGWQVRLNLARALLVPSDLLLLDEPTNHLDLDTIFFLENWLKNYQGTLLVISHDRDFLDRVVDQVIHIEHQKLNCYKGNYTQFEKTRIEKITQSQVLYQKQEKVKAHMMDFVNRFKAKASKAKQAQSRLKALDKLADITPLVMESGFDFSFKTSLELPYPVALLEKLVLGYDDVVILKKIEFEFSAGMRVGLLGKNGAGKSTFLKLLSGDLAPIEGQFYFFKGVHVGYFSQHHVDNLPKQMTALSYLQSCFPTFNEQEIRNILGQFNFQEESVYKKIGSLSGGERSRLVLALLVQQKPNLLILDEPTNHLDLDMRQALNMALQTFLGGVILVSHDMYLLNTICDSFYLVDNQEITLFQGNLMDYQNYVLANKSQQKKMNVSSEKNNTKIHQKKRILWLAEQKKITNKIDKIQCKLDDIEQALSDESLYVSSNNNKLNQLLEQQSALVNDKEMLENEWFDIEILLEEKQK